MEVLVLVGLALAGLFALGVVVATAGLLWWLVTLPIRIVLWVAGAVFFLVLGVALLPLFAVALVLLLLVAPLLLLGCLLGWC